MHIQQTFINLPPFFCADLSYSHKMYQIMFLPHYRFLPDLVAHQPIY